MAWRNSADIGDQRSIMVIFLEMNKWGTLHVLPEEVLAAA